MSYGKQQQETFVLGSVPVIAFYIPVLATSEFYGAGDCLQVTGSNIIKDE